MSVELTNALIKDMILDKNSDDVKLIERLEKKILELSEYPYLCAEKSFKSRKCPKCKKRTWCKKVLNTDK